MLRLFNSLTRKKEIFKPLKRGQVTMYNCGPTVYDYAHLGNLRAFLLADVLRRYLEWRDYKVKQVMNITDVGHMVADVDVGKDKLEAAAQKEKKTPWQIAEFYTKAFFKDIDALNIKHAWKYPRATEHIKEMIKIIKKLLKYKRAYIVNGSVYYDLKTFPGYGKLSGNKVSDLVAGKSVEIKKEKKNSYDFALWIEDTKHLMQWRAPWSVKAGYPGWHLECSAMAMKYLGETLDIHTGGEDNKFPHHECEIAQSEGASHKQFVDYWLHIKHLLVDGQKMSKSLGNFYTLKDILNHGFSPRAARYVLISSHYRDALNFTFESLKAAQTALERLDEFSLKIQNMAAEGRSLPLPAGEGWGEGSQRATDFVQTTRDNFIQALDDDLNMSKAMAVVFEFVHKINQEVSSTDAKKVLKLLKDFDQVLGLNLGQKRKIVIPQSILKLAKEREKARQEKNWAQADKLRQEIEKQGYLIKDTPQGPEIKTRLDS